MKRFLVVIPSYNEELNLPGVLRELLGLRLETDVLVVNDGSKDRTAAVASEFPVHVVSHPCNLGYGAALQTGFKYAVKQGYDYVLTLDADGQHNALDLIMIIKEIERGEADIVIGSRYIEALGYTSGPVKRLAVVFFRGLIRLFTKAKISDPTSGQRGFKRHVFQYYAGSGRFPQDFPDVDVLIHMLLRKYRIKEISATMRERKQGVSMHSGLKPIFYMIKMMLCIVLVLIRSKRESYKEAKAGVKA
ncbi:glycosyltransferase family 2 protein [Paenibacillus cremeus]|uniref:Glycosyltransferase family 2 protein n=1 Tax=Paenibacillus cremeus TaxID=2163881 RepID=A0A559K6G4_9BACL|nr:glycosyltransferase family 2 protein [Paenibacillus cremeus]TVY07711.1 glycosyltransferase family 2 protein [Paenibacillus cremeus]